MKIGIITYHRAINYGAFLQCYALCSRLNQEDNIEAEVIDYKMEIEKELYGGKINKGMIKHPIISYMRLKMLKRQKFLFNEDYKKLRMSSSHLISDCRNDFNEYVRKLRYDVIICGSDEIWKTDGFRGFPNAYWLIGDIGCRKYSYAVSSRSDFSKLDQNDALLLKETLNDYDFIGVRDRMTYAEVKKYVEEKSKVVLCCDPTFLFDFKPDKNNGKAILNRLIKKNDNRKNVVVMIENDQIAKEIYSQLKNKYNLICVYLWHPRYINGCELSPFEWIDVLYSCDFVITSFFHAICFSLKYNTPFMAIGTGDKSSKLIELANDVNIPSFKVYEPNIAMESCIGEIVDNNISAPEIDHHFSDGLFKGFEIMLQHLQL